MNDNEHSSYPADETPESTSRRKFLGAAALTGLTGAGLATGLAALGSGEAKAEKEEEGEREADKFEVPPGQLDDYYIFSSGGHSGEVRIYGLPSGRTIKRIPVFNIDPMVGWGITNESKKVIGTKPDGSLKYITGDTHHVHGSYTDGTYDSRYLWVNDKIHGRLARIRMDYMECDKITELPNMQGFHGLFPDKRDPVDPKINRTTRVFCGGEFHVPLPNDGRDMDDSKKWACLFSCVDADSMEVRWQCKVTGNMDLVATSYDGKLAAANQYNTEGGAIYTDMMSAERDAVVFFNIERIEAAIKAGKFITIGDSKVPVVDGTKDANPDPKTALVCYVPVPKNPHGVNITPDGKYFISSGKLSPTASVTETALVHKWFAGELKEARDTVVAEPEIGLGPLHTAFDDKGNAYTTLFLDSQIVKWNIDKAIAQFKGDKKIQPVLDRVDVHYQPGHGYSSMGETKEADGKFFNSGNKFSKDRFLPVGPLHVETEQLIDISGDKMKLIHDHTAYPEPHDAIIVRRDLVKTKQIYSMDEFPNAVKNFTDSKVERNGNKVTVYLASVAPQYSMTNFKVKKGDEVTIILTNHDKVEDLTHGFAIPKYDINFIVNPQQTASVTFIADKPGVYWCYCSHFCHALHLEMRSTMFVEA
ncbi:Nitrous-oxide reductase [Candidatus Competibacter denitrificans Run_A_D11]|uniref:Nitrous-oxide reductase n=1 Tax=Candidatus Competibacter denitrificans Run_A_D11 TaxID=1400863 RepID=W6MCZ5_9GAMM|nr:TAT-dependent nitrous-oxide reductase [Candidatus Competibacter denitrificans]CDI04485.1 Nitrous-oxide reductase [Candidatus Competibacter denitrificans Run_A_D11]HRC70334.1 TAT-dependent nitrous-oxide reductase [Candidatus Competibacter denitrificans]